MEDTFQLNYEWPPLDFGINTELGDSSFLTMLATAVIPYTY
jgi:hypothetical protein